MQSEEGKDLTTKRGKNDLPFNMDEIQGPHLEGETAKISHYAVQMVWKYKSLGISRTYTRFGRVNEFI